MAGGSAFFGDPSPPDGGQGNQREDKGQGQRFHGHAHQGTWKVRVVPRREEAGRTRGGRRDWREGGSCLVRLFTLYSVGVPEGRGYPTRSFSGIRTAVLRTFVARCNGGHHFLLPGLPGRLGENRCN